MNKPQTLTAILLMTTGVGVASAQTCRDDIIATTPYSDFTVHDTGTVSHNTTGLMWMHCSLGQEWDGSTCSGSVSIYSWQSALQVANGFSYEGYSDWRLPNKNELTSIVEERCGHPAINTTIFPNTGHSPFWSSSPFAVVSHSAWVVRFRYGIVDLEHKSSTIGQVRLVRDAQ